MSDMACYCGYDPAIFYRADRVTARKAHKCYECRGEIRPGDSYERVSAMWDRGHIDTHATCAACLSLREWTAAHVPCFCWAHGSLLDDALETIREYAHHVPGMFMEFGRLYVQATRRPQP